jgi:uncharacterized protein YdeI (BOF family)
MVIKLFQILYGTAKDSFVFNDKEDVIKVDVADELPREDLVDSLADAIEIISRLESLAL